MFKEKLTTCTFYGALQKHVCCVWFVQFIGSPPYDAKKKIMALVHYSLTTIHATWTNKL